LTSRRKKNKKLRVMKNKDRLLRKTMTLRKTTTASLVETLRIRMKRKAKTKSKRNFRMKSSPPSIKKKRPIETILRMQRQRRTNQVKREALQLVRSADDQ